MSDRACAIHSVQARVKESPILWTAALWTRDHHALPMSIFDRACILALHGLDRACIDSLLIAFMNWLDVGVNIKPSSIVFVIIQGS